MFFDISFGTNSESRMFTLVIGDLHLSIHIDKRVTVIECVALAVEFAASDENLTYETLQILYTCKQEIIPRKVKKFLSKKL